MKKLMPHFLFLILISALSCRNEPKETLRILEENYPRAFFFRIPQFIDEPYDEWERKYNRLMGIEAKVLEEELPGISDPNIEFFTRFKHNNPDQFVAVHYNGNSRDPRNDTKDFFPGHWLYFNGAGVLSEIPAAEEITEIKVTDASLFKTGIGRYSDRNEDLGICELDAEGKPDWHKSEQVQLVSIDAENNTIRVRRGCYGTSPRTFQPGRTYIASHVSSGPWEEFGNLMWFYNHSTVCPRDKAGKNCTDILVSDIAKHFLKGGDLEVFNGIEFDVMFNSLSQHNFVKSYYSPGSNRAPDPNADGIPDDGVFDGKNTYGEGIMQFYRKLRSLVGEEKLIMADHNSSAQQRAFGLINGIECEGWPVAGDYKIKCWSGGINRNLFWDENARAPRMNYINHKWSPKILDTVDIPISNDRLVMAVSCLTGTAIGEGFYLPEKEPGQSKPAIWDELVMGQSNTPGWLGKPISQVMRLAKHNENIFSGRSLEQLKQRIKPAGELPVSITWDGNAIKIEGEDSDNKNIMEIEIEKLPCTHDGLSLFMTFTGRPMKNSSMECGRVAYVTPLIPGLNIAERWYTAYMNMEPFESAFYYPDLPEKEVSISVKIESNEAVWIHSMEAYASPDIMVREFENGIVLANPAPYTVKIDLEALFPDRKFQRLQGSSRQDPVTNDGSMVNGEVELGAKDGLFLISHRREQEGMNTKE